MPEKEFRACYGIDSHAFEETECKKLVLAGTAFENEKGLKAHSDGDVALHALFNAISSAAGGKSIGHYFPDSKPEFKNADSKIFIEKALQLMKEKGFRLNNLGLMIECLKPKIEPRADEMKDNLSRLLSLDKERISIIATTGEGLTSFGQGKGIHVSCTVSLTK
ncbi:2-C-methyl-D-erythritol 2,4-cyclodiphosphate synthase [archaeon]|nr:2-C-methyl-D-erythritol 2,4-cyclodiphosphate synthase [archaeon]